MDTATEVATPAADVVQETPAAPVAETPVKPEATPEETSISAHAAKYNPNRARDEKTGRFVEGGKSDDAKPAQEATPAQPRRREKDIATPGDTPRINELTRKLRDAERRAQELEARTQQPVTRQPTNVPANGNGGTDHWAFPKPEPKQVDFANADDPYAAWLEARQDWRLEKRDFEMSLQQQTSTAQETEQQFWNSFDGKMSEFAKQTPDWQAVFAGDGPEHMREHMPPAMQAMIFMDDNPGRLMYAFARDAALFDEVASWSEGIRIPAANASEDERNAALAAVSRLRRRLDRRGFQTAVTASVPATPHVTVVPKPPNAVRTGPMRSGDEPPGDGHTIADHARTWGPKGRR